MAMDLTLTDVCIDGSLPLTLNKTFSVECTMCHAFSSLFRIRLITRKTQPNAEVISNENITAIHLGDLSQCAALPLILWSVGLV